MSLLLIDHEITLKILEFILNSIEKVKPVVFFYFPQYVCFLNWTEQNPNLTAFTSKILVFCRPEQTKRGTPWKQILTIFKWKNEFPRQLGLICLVFMSPSWVIVLKFSKLCLLWNILVMSAKNLRLLQQFVYMHL